VIEGVEEFGSELDTAPIRWPGQRECLGKREIEVRLAGAVHNTCSAIPEGRR